MYSVISIADGILHRFLLRPRSVSFRRRIMISQTSDRSDGRNLDFVARLEGLFLGGAGKEDRGLLEKSNTNGLSLRILTG